MAAVIKVSPVLLVAALLSLVPFSGPLATASEDTGETKELAPIEIVTVTSNEVLGILRDEKLAGDELKPERLRRFREAITGKFDWPAIARHGLGVHWRKITEKQRDEFTALFRKFLEQVYFRQLTIHGAGANLSYEKEKIKGDRATVYTIAEEDGVETHIDYVMRRTTEDDDTGSHWLIYDVKVEGVSLLLSYREQFNEVMVSSNFEALLKKLKKKVEKAEKSE